MTTEVLEVPSSATSNPSSTASKGPTTTTTSSSSSSSGGMASAGAAAASSKGHRPPPLLIGEAIANAQAIDSSYGIGPPPGSLMSATKPFDPYFSPTGSGGPPSSVNPANPPAPGTTRGFLPTMPPYAGAFPAAKSPTGYLPPQPQSSLHHGRFVPTPSMSSALGIPPPSTHSAPFVLGGAGRSPSGTMSTFPMFQYMDAGNPHAMTPAMSSGYLNSPSNQQQAQQFMPRLSTRGAGTGFGFDDPSLFYLRPPPPQQPPPAAAVYLTIPPAHVVWTPEELSMLEQAMVAEQATLNRNVLEGCARVSVRMKQTKSIREIAYKILAATPNKFFPQQ